MSPKTICCLLTFILFITHPVEAQSSKEDFSDNIGLETLFLDPPEDAGTWVYWWWLNGYVSKEGILRELDAFRDKGISGALIFHAGNGFTPGHTPFMSRQWREYFRFAVEEAAKRGITISLNLCEGWNAGGPWVTEEHASMSLQYSQMILEGPAYVDTLLPDLPKDSFREDLFTYAWEKNKGACSSESWVDVSSYVDPDGRIQWEVPGGEWMIVRFGKYVNNMGFIHYSNDPMWIKEKYFETNEMDREGLNIHFDHTAKILIEEVKPHVGKTFTHLHIDSGETGHPDWTPGFYTQFQRRRDYDARKFMAAKAGQIIDSKEITGRFLEDYTMTQGDLIVEAYYGGLAERAGEYGMGTHSESAGYQKPTVDALRALGVNNIAMGEFWSRSSGSYIHQATQKQLSYHDAIRNVASAAHIYGRKIVQAEAYTATGLINYTVPLYDLKDIGDRAFCQGLNRTVLHHFVHQPECSGTLPGYAWPNIGISFSVNRTWWDWSGSWFNYLNRCHIMLQTGRFIADVCYFQGEWVPSYVPARWFMDPSLPRGHDCDVINAQVLTEKATVNENGELVLPGGMTYRYLVLDQGEQWQKPPWSIFKKPNEEPFITEWPDIASGNPIAMSPSTMIRIKELVSEGLTLVGPPPDRAIGLSAYPASDAEVSALVIFLWGKNPGPSGARQVGKGRVIWGKRLQEIMTGDDLLPDLEYTEDTETTALPLPVETSSGIPDPIGFDWVHRRNADADYYFLANLRNEEAGAEFFFRQNDCRPELWDPLTGKMRDLYEFCNTGDGRISVPLKFAPRQSYFIVFRRAHILGQKQDKEPENEKEATILNFPATEKILELEGAWTVDFDPERGGPGDTLFENLMDWSTNEDERIRHYSGIARYSKDFVIKRSMIDPKEERKILLDLGRVEVMARVFLNGQELGTLWTAPWQVEMTGALKPGKNKLEIEVVNLWRNRMIGDADKLEEDRITGSNVQVRSDEILYPSGLMGPVVIRKTNK